MTGRPAEDFETIARRYAAPFRNQRTFGNWLRAWLDHLAMGRHCFLATSQDARKVVEITAAIERSLRTRKAIELPLTAE